MLVRMKTTSNFRPTAEAKGYLDTLLENKSFRRSIDAYVLAAAYAMKMDLSVEDIQLKGRSDLIDVGILEEDVRLALECGLTSIRRRKNLEDLTDSAEVLDGITKYAEIGLRALKQRWDGKGGLQIQRDMKLLAGESQS